MKRKLSLLMAVSLAFTQANSVYGATFTDTTGHWAETAINEWSNYNVVSGYQDGSFKPKNEITRAEVAALIDKVMHYQETSSTTFKDLNGTEWYASSVLKNVGAGNMNGYTDGTVGANRSVTRQEVAAMLCSAFEIEPVSGDTTFADDASIPAWSKGSIKALQSLGYINGRNGNVFAPTDAITRAEVVAMLDNIVSDLYSTADTYTNVSNGNVVVNTPNVILKDKQINGNLYVAAGVGNGDLTLDNVVVTGEVIVEGGGTNSVKFTNGSNARGVKVQKNSDTGVRIFVDEKSTVSHVDTAGKSSVKLEGQGSFGAVNVNGTNNVEVATGTNIDKVAVNGGGTLTNNGVIVEITISNNAVNVTIKGTGTAETVTANNSQVVLDLNVIKVVLANDNVKITVSDKVQNVVDKAGNDAKDKVTGNVGGNTNTGNSNNNSSENNSGGGGSTTTDTTAPKIAETAFYAYSITDTTATIRFDSNEAGTYTYALNGVPANGQGNLHVGGNGLNLKNLKPESEYTFALTVKDAAGNTATYTIKFKTIATADVIVPPVAKITTSSAVVVKGTSTIVDITDWFNYGNLDASKVKITTSKSSDLIDCPTSGYAATTGRLTLKFTAEDLANTVVGETYEIQVKAYFDVDGDGRYDTAASTPVTLSVKVSEDTAPVNNAPVLSSSFATNKTVSDSVVSWDLTNLFTDADGDDVSVELISANTQGYDVLGEFKVTNNILSDVYNNVNGTYTFVVRAKDSKGATSQPVTLTLTRVINYCVSSTTVENITSSSAAVKFIATQAGAYEYQLTKNGNWIGSNTGTAVVGENTIILTDLDAETTYYVSIDVNEYDNPYANPNNHIIFETLNSNQLDVKAPTVKYLSPNNTTWTDNNLDISFNTNELGTYTLTLAKDGSTISNFTGSLAKNGFNRIPLKGLEDGSYVATLVAKDLVGNETAPITANFSLDTTAPSLTNTSDKIFTFQYGNTKTNVIAKFNSDEVGLYTYSVYKNGVFEYNGNKNIPLTLGENTIALNDFESGNYKVVVQASDSIGTNTTELNIEFVVREENLISFYADDFIAIDDSTNNYTTSSSELRFTAVILGEYTYTFAKDGVIEKTGTSTVSSRNGNGSPNISTSGLASGTYDYTMMLDGVAQKQAKITIQ